MEWMPCVHDALEYIEENLFTVKDQKEVAEQLDISEADLQKGFLVLSGYSVFEYIRNRKLYEAALKIISTDSRIIDVALESGYESQEAFTRAFIRFHGINPGALRKKGEGYRIFLPIKVDLTVYGGTKRNLKTIRKPSFTIIGYSKNIKSDPKSENDITEIQEFWNDFYNRYYDGFDENGELYEESSVIEKNGIGEFGVRFIENDGTFTYMIAGKYTGGKVPDGMSIKDIPEGEWAVFDYTGPTKVGLIDFNIPSNIDFIENDREYEQKEDLYIEWYESIYEDKTTEGYRSALWVPIRAKTDNNLIQKRKRIRIFGTFLGFFICIGLIFLITFLNKNDSDMTDDVLKQYDQPSPTPGTIRENQTIFENDTDNTGLDTGIFNNSGKKDTDQSELFYIKTDIDDSIPIEEKDVYFFSKESKEAEEYIHTQEQGIKMILVYGEGLSEEGLTIGKPISVRNTKDFYYVPVFQNGKCIHIVSLLKNDDEFIMNSSKGFADYLNSLEPNSYYFESIHNEVNSVAGIYICGQGLKLSVERIGPENFCKNFYKDGDVTELNTLEGEIKIDIFEDIYTCE